MNRRIKLTIEYDGTNYAGWQVQPNAVTIQEKIENALYQVTRSDIRIHGAGRTDAGVHALAQTAHFDTEARIPSENFAAALNTFLPDDIRIIESKQVPDDFHARYLAKGKVYRYTIYNRACASALLRDTTCYVRESLDTELMNEAALQFIGVHDFSAFCAVKSSVENKVRMILRAEVKADLPLITFTVAGNGFLYNMVRIMAGTLIDVGRGKISSTDVKAIIETKDRTRAPFTAPPQGLALKAVLYKKKDEML